MDKTNLQVGESVGKNLVVGDHNLILEVGGDLIFKAAQSAALQQRDLRKMLRVLVVLAGPVFDPRNPQHDPTPLDLLTEWQKLSAAVAASGAPIALIRLTPPTLEALRYALSPRAVEQGLYPHVLHFSGHAWQDGLLFEDQYGSLDAVPSLRLLAELKDCPPLGLAVFNACQSAEHAFSAAQAFSAAGRAQAALGHPDPVRDDEAIQFAASLYAELARGGYPLEAAFERAAQQVSSHRPRLFGETGLSFNGLEAGKPLIEDHLPPGNLPAREKFFFGRAAELNDLAHGLEKTPLVAVLSGVSGIGKTALALEAAQRSAWRFPGGIGFGDGRGAPSAEFLLRGMAAALELPLLAGQPPEEPLLALARQKPTLFLLDNLEGLSAPDLERIAAFLRRLGRGSAALATLRPPAPVFENLPAARSIALTGGLAEAAGARYVLALAEHWQIASLQRGDLALRLARASGGHPLILEKLVALVRKRPLAHMLESIATLGSDYREILKTVMDWSLESLDDQARAALACLPIFGAGSCTPAALAAALAIEQAALYPRLDPLRDSALLAFEPDTERWAWHASVSDYARAALNSPDYDACCRRALEQICDVFSKLPGSADSSTRPDLLADLQNLYLLAEWAGGQPDGEALARLATSPSNWWSLLSYHTAWQSWLESALHKGIADNGLEANVRKAIGDVQQFRKELDAALVSYNEALKRYQEIGSKLGEANVLAALSRMDIGAGKVEEAEQKMAVILQMRREIDDLYSEGADLGNFAIVLLNAGHKQKAREYAQKARVIFEKIDLPAIVAMMDKIIQASG
ncbi:MAG: CHAT domain-containing protein [Anaerolineales bacterium]|jgi:tetratricopeptide (TPR) repeat protein|nr:CHAT domain-containing protein [Anaerolineales bacterium]